MKKNVIAVLLSIVMTVGSVGAVPVFGAETTTQEAVAVEEEEQEAEDFDETDAEVEESVSDTEDDADQEGTTGENDDLTTEASSGEEAGQIEEESEGETADQIEQDEFADTAVTAEVAVDDEETNSSDWETASAGISEDEEAVVVEEETITAVEKEAVLAGDVVASGSCGQDAIWTLTGTENAYTLTISGSGGIYRDTFIDQCRDYYQNIEIVIIEYGITTIGSYFFEDFNSLQNITIANSVTSIESCAFENCGSLQYIVIPVSVTRIGNNAFEDCKSLEGITIPKNVAYMDGSFEGCSSLAYINVDSDNEKYKSIDGVLFTTNYYDENGYYVDDYDEAEYYETGLTRYPSNKTGTYYRVPDDVNFISSYAFSGNKYLEEVDLPSSLPSDEWSSMIGSHAFEQCTNLKKIVIPEGIEEFYEYTFYGCENLTDVTLPQSLKTLGMLTFACCSSLEHIDLPSNLQDLGGDYYGGAFENSGIKSITIPEGIIEIPKATFWECEKLESITLPQSLSVIEDHAFRRSGLKTITFPKALGQILDNAFSGCSSLKEMIFEGPAPYINMGNNFSGVNAIAYYPPDDSTWTEEVISSFSSSGKITWVPFGTGIHAENITLNKTSATLVKGKTLQLKATVTPAGATDGKVTWKSGDTKVATVTSTGKVNAVAAGTATITATTAGGLKATCKIKVVNPYTIKFDKNAAKATLTTTTKKVNPGSAIGTLPTPKYAGYYFLGWYTAKTGGTKISASTKPTKNLTLYAHWVARKSIKKATVKVASCVFNGKTQRPSVTVTLGKTKLKKDTDYTVTYSNNINAGSKAVVKITGKGKYKDSISKKFTISKCGMGAKYITAKLTKTTYNYSGNAIKPGITVYLNGWYKLTKGTDYKVTYKNNKEPGKATVQITGMGNFVSSSRSFTFTIAKLNQPIKLSTSSLSLKYKNIGATYEVTATGVKESAGLTVSSTNTAVAVVSGSNGKYKIKIKGCGKADIIFKTNKATKHYKITTKKLPITVTDDRKTPTITLPQQEYSLRAEDAPFNLGATCDSDGALTYTSSDTEILTVDSTGTVTVTGNKEGTVNVTVTSKATKNYKKGTAVVNITVTLTPIWVQRLNEFRNDPRWQNNGASWDYYHSTLLSNNATSAIGCAAYVNDFVAYVYGRRNTKDDPVTRIDTTYNYGKEPKYYDISEVRVGDVVAFESNGKNPGHYFAVLEINEDNGIMYTMEGNYGDTNGTDGKIRTGYGYQIVNGKLLQLNNGSVVHLNFTWTKHFDSYKED